MFREKTLEEKFGVATTALNEIAHHAHYPDCACVVIAKPGAICDCPSGVAAKALKEMQTPIPLKGD